MEFHKHYTLEEARALLPEVRRWLHRLTELRGQFEKANQGLAAALETGADCGGKEVNRSLRTLVALKDVLEEFRVREIQVKDLKRGLVDFPAVRESREVFLCWEQGEEDIEFYHELDAGYAGRQRL